MTEEDKKSGKIKGLEAILKDPFHKTIYGALNLSSNSAPYGPTGMEAGKSVYSQLMGTPDANEAVKKAKGMLGDLDNTYSAPREYYIEKYVKGSVESAFEGLSLNNLYEVVGKEMGGLKAKIDKEKGKYSLAQLQEDREGKISKETKEYVANSVMALRQGYADYRSRQILSPEQTARNLDSNLEALNDRYGLKKAA